MAPTHTVIGHHRAWPLVRPHSHEEHELIVVVCGACRIAMAGRDHALQAGDGLLIPAGEEHDQSDDAVYA